MALIKSSLLAEISGSIGGTTYARNRGGQYARQRAVPVNPNTPAQQAARAAMQTAVQRWISVLTQAQRDAWDVYAANVPMTNRLGDPILLTGQQQYIRQAVVTTRTVTLAVQDAPTTFDIGVSGVIVPPDISVATGISVQYSGQNTWQDDDQGALIVQQGLPQNASQATYHGPFTFAGKIDGSASTPPSSPQVITSLHALAAGQRNTIRVRALSGDGRLSGASQFTVTVVA